MRAGRVLILLVTVSFVGVGFGDRDAHARRTAAKPPGLSQKVFRGRDAARSAAIDTAVRNINRNPRVKARFGLMTPRRLLARVFRIDGNVLAFQVDSRQKYDGVPALGDQLHVVQRKDGAARSYLKSKASVSFADE